MIRAVIDTNVIVSSIIGSGPPAEIMRRARAREFVPVLSGYILEETWRVMVDKLHFDASDVESILLRVASVSEVVPLFETSNMWCDDPADNPVAETAVLGRADILVTGDKRLLTTLRMPVRAMEPAAFLGELDTLGR